MKGRTVLAGIGVLVLLLAGLLLSGVVRVPGQDDGRPACGELPSRQEVRSALSEKASLVQTLESTGAGVTVRSSTPCGDDDRALITVSYATDAEESALDRVLTEGEGFGVPVEVVRQD